MGIEKLAKLMGEPYQIPPPSRIITRHDLDPLIVRGLEAQGIDPDDYLERLNQTTANRLARKEE